MERAIRAAKKLGIMLDFLNRNAKEIENMFFGEYDYDMDIAVQREEAFADGEARGHAAGLAEGEARGHASGLAEGERNKALETAQNLLRMGLSPEQTSQITSLPLEQVLALKEEIAIQN